MRSRSPKVGLVLCAVAFLTVLAISIAEQWVTARVWTTNIYSFPEKSSDPPHAASSVKKRRFCWTRQCWIERRLDRRRERIQKRQQVALKPVAPSPRVQPLLPAVDKQNIRKKHRIIADETLRLLPIKCQSTLKNFYVRYDNPEHRGLAGKSTIILNGNLPDKEFRALLIHEFGHVMDLGCLAGMPNSGKSGFRDGNEDIYRSDPSVSFYQISWITGKVKRVGTKDEDFVSGYASWDAFEDFAESVAYYILQRDAFHKRAQKNAALAAKYNWIETHLFPNGISIASGLHQWSGRVPWDVTKLAYTWHPPQTVVSQR